MQDINHQNEVTIFGEHTFHNKRVRFGIRTDDRRRHMYVIGKTGVGKTTLLDSMAISDIQRGHGVGIIDPHGEFADRLLDFVPKDRVNDVIYINPADLEWPIAFNPMEQVPFDYRHLVASGLMGVFKKIWIDVWSARMEYILNNTLLALLEYPGSTMLSVNRMMYDKDFRKEVIDKVTDPVVKAFWLNEYARYQQRYEIEATAAIQNKVGQFVSNPLIRNVIGQTASKLNLRQVLDEGKILVVNLSKGLIGEDSSALLGGLVVTKLQLAAMSRIDIPEKDRRDFYLYVDEFQNYATESFANILAEARKYRLNLILAHQYIEQLPEEVEAAIFGNVGTIVCFRLGAEDAESLEKEFEPEFMANDLVNLPKWQFYTKLMIDGVTSRAFSAITIPPLEKPSVSYREEIIGFSRSKYATPRKDVEGQIREWSGEAVRPQEEIMGKAPLPAVASPLWEAKCDICGKTTKVPFKPDGRRPVYCKECLKTKQDMIAKAVQSRLESEPVVRGQEEPISLREAIKRSEPERRRKDIDTQGLRDVLKEVLGEKKE
ncbi:MAG: type IV secretion system DNA-binding domain-containing protein [Parcubacteria group bacterium]|nr:type IV secretion system DNA-binding domain-containing protein [Parcubacteria group bacterium]